MRIRDKALVRWTESDVIGLFENNNNDGEGGAIFLSFISRANETWREGHLQQCSDLSLRCNQTEWLNVPDDDHVFVRRGDQTLETRAKRGWS